MASGKPSDAKPKVMDVSKPGKGKIVVNSRPIAAPVVSDKAASDDVLTQPLAEPETAPVLSPSAVKKTIQPISVSSDEPEPETEPAAEATAEAPDAPAQTDDAVKSEDESPVAEEATEQEPDSEPGPEADKSAEEPADPPSEPEAEKAAEEAPKSTDNLPTPAADDDSPIAPAAPATDQSGAASVDELAKAAEQKRLAAEKSKEEQERDKKVQELINSKQYNVPIKHSVRRSKLPLAMVLVTLLLAAAGYLLVDIGVFGKNIKPPYEFFKETEVTSTLTTENADQTDATEEPDIGAHSDLPQIQAAEDDERRSELRNLQQKLETHFSDKGEYPASLAELSPPPTADELQDDDGQAYAYTSDGETYVLSVKLSDGTTYSLESVAQP